MCTRLFRCLTFLLGVPVSEISQEDDSSLKLVLKTIYSQLNFRSLVESGRYRRLLERLDEILDELETIPSRNLCGVLLELGDELPDESKGLFDFGSDLLVGRLIYRLLWKLGELEKM